MPERNAFTLRARENGRSAGDRADRGPIAGHSKAAENRAQACEDALWFVLQLEGVKEILQARIAEAIPPCPLVSSEKAHWAKYPLRTVGELDDFRRACQQVKGEE